MIMPGPQNLKDYFAMLWVFSLQWLQRSSKSNMSIFTHNYAQLQNIVEHCREWAGRGGHLRCSRGLPDSLVKRCSTRSEDLWKSPDVESKALMKLQIMFAFVIWEWCMAIPEFPVRFSIFFALYFPPFLAIPVWYSVAGSGASQRVWAMADSSEAPGCGYAGFAWINGSEAGSREQE